MSLPKITVPTYSFKVPSSGTNIKVRPFTVKEEKVLLMAAESKDINEVINSVKQIISNCIISGEFDVDKTPFFDIDFLFIYLRAKSIGEGVDIRITCNNTLEDGNVCNARFPSKLNIENMKMIKTELSNNIKLDRDKGVVMRYPTYSVIKHLENGNAVDKKTSVIVSSIEHIYDKKGVYSWKDYSKEQLTEFVEGLTEANYNKLEEWTNGFPTFYIEVNEKCPKCGFEHKLRYSDFFDFFFS